MSTLPKDYLAAGLLGIVASTTFSGLNFSLGYIAIPALVGNTEKQDKSTTETSKLGDGLARQWQIAFNNGHKIGPAAAVTSAASFAYAALISPEGLSRQQNLTIAASLLAICVVPFTLIFINATNEELHRRADGRPVDGQSSSPGAWLRSMQTPRLVARWGQFCNIRGGITAAAAISGLSALLI